MSEKRQKIFKKMARAFGSVFTVKELKNLRRQRIIRANIPKRPTIVSKKRHPGESVYDFKDRRKKCNERRRLRERSRAWAH